MAISKSYQINGVLDTNKTVLENLEILTSSCNSFFTCDVHSGKWSIVVNQPGTSQKSFDDSNIIGSILLSTTGITDYYNEVQVDFPHKDLLDQTDTIIESIPEANWFPNEQRKILKLSFDTINDPVQAQLLGAVQLKQSRVDQIIKFDTDYTSLGLSAGDLITVTNDIYGFSNKLFRVINISESDDNDGGLKISITALEYNSDVYNTTTLTRQLRTPKTGIIQKNANTDIKNDVSIGGLAIGVGALAALGAVEKLLTGSVAAGGIFDSIFKLFAEKTGIDILGSATSGGSLSNVTVKDEGKTLTSSAKIINFTGSGVTATKSGDTVTVKIDTVTSSGTSGTTGTSTAIKNPSSNSSSSYTGEACPLTYLTPGTYYVPRPEPKKIGWADSCTIGKIWTVRPTQPAESEVKLTIIPKSKTDTSDGKMLVLFEISNRQAILPIVDYYYSVTGHPVMKGWVRCVKLYGNKFVEMEYPFSHDIVSTGLELTGNNPVASTAPASSYTSGIPTSLKAFTVFNPQDLTYAGQYTVKISCTAGEISGIGLRMSPSDTKNIKGKIVSGSQEAPEGASAVTKYDMDKRDYYNEIVITPKHPLEITGSAYLINQIIGQGTWTYYKDEDQSKFLLPPPDQKVTISYAITYNGTTRTLNDTMTYKPYDEWLTYADRY